MAHKYLIGNTTVSDEEFAAMEMSGELKRFMADGKNNANAEIAFSSGLVRAGDVSLGAAEGAGSGETPSHTPIGIGRPISIEILSAYTGKVPGWGKKDVLAVSGVKTPQTYAGSVRGVNQVFKNTSEHTLVEPSAFANGSPHCSLQEGAYRRHIAHVLRVGV